MTDEEKLDFVMAEPDAGSVLEIKVAYPESPKTYCYAAVNVGTLWFLTGSAGGAGHSWSGLASWFNSKNASIVSMKTATSWEDTL